MLYIGFDLPAWKVKERPEKVSRGGMKKGGNTFPSIIIVIFFSISNWFTQFYIQQDNIKKLTKKTYKNKQQHKDKTSVTFENVNMTKTK